MDLPKGIKAFIIAPRREIKEFFTTVTVQQLSVGAISLFEPIYLYQQGVSIRGIILFNLAVYLPYLFLIPFGGAFAKKFGYEHSLATATFVNSAYFIALALIPIYPVVIFIAPFIAVIQKTLWWPAYHANFARFSKKKQMGREIGSLNALYTLASALGPFVGGVILLFFNFTSLYVFGVVMMLLSVIPMFTTREKFMPSSLKWGEQFKHLFAKKYFRRFMGGFGYGEEFITQTIWPLFIFFILGDSLDVGVLVGFATILTIAVSIATGRIMDRYKKLKINAWSAGLILISWVLRPFSDIPLTLFLGDTTSRVGKFAQMIPAYSAVYADGKKNHVMKEVVSFEMSLIIGKLVMMGALLIFFSFSDSMPYAFWLAVPFSALYFFFK